MRIDAEQQATRVGAIALVVLVAAIGFFVFVYGELELGSHVRVYVYFHSVAALHEGAPVIIGGRTVGEVEAIALSPAGARTPLAGAEGVVVTVSLAADAAARIVRGGDVFLASRGAFSDRYLEIGPSPTHAEVLREGDQILGTDPPSLDRVLQRTWDQLQTTTRFLDDVRPELTALRGELRALAATLADLPAPAPLRPEVLALAAEAARTRDVALGGEPGLAHLRASLALTRATLAELRVTLAELDARATMLRAGIASVQGRLGAGGATALARVQDAIDRARAAFAKVDPLLAAATDLADRLARGEGTIGKLMTDPEFPEDTKDLGKMLKRAPWKLIGHPIP